MVALIISSPAFKELRGQGHSEQVAILQPESVPTSYVVHHDWQAGIYGATESEQPAHRSRDHLTYNSESLLPPHETPSRAFVPVEQGAEEQEHLFPAVLHNKQDFQAEERSRM